MVKPLPNMLVRCQASEAKHPTKFARVKDHVLPMVRFDLGSTSITLWFGVLDS